MYFDILRINEPLLNDFLKVRINMRPSEIKEMIQRANKKVRVRTVLPKNITT